MHSSIKQQPYCRRSISFDNATVNKKHPSSPQHPHQTSIKPTSNLSRNLSLPHRPRLQLNPLPIRPRQFRIARRWRLRHVNRPITHLPKSILCPSSPLLRLHTIYIFFFIPRLPPPLPTTSLILPRSVPLLTPLLLLPTTGACCPCRPGTSYRTRHGRAAL